MLNDRHVEPSLGDLYHQLMARVCRAVSKAMIRSHITGTDLEQIRFRLQAWDETVGATKGSLDELEGADAAMARDFFNKLLREFDHIEVSVGVKLAPSNGSSAREDPILHFKNLLLNRPNEDTRNEITLRDITLLVTESNERRQQSTASPPSTEDPLSPPSLASRSPYYDEVPPSRDQTSSPFIAMLPSDAQRPPSQPYAALSYSPMTIDTGTPTAADSPSNMTSPPASLPSNAAYSTSPLASVNQLLSHQHQESTTLQTPSTLSAFSSPMTPFAPYQSMPPQQPIVNLATNPGPSTGIPDYQYERDRDRQQPYETQQHYASSIWKLSPLQSSEPSPAASISSHQHQAMEPRTESSMESQLRGRSTNLGLEWFSTDSSRGRESPGASP